MSREFPATDAEGRLRTPYAVTCRLHGFVYLTDKEYEDQMWKCDSLWKCPLCHCTAVWSDDNCESFETADGKP